MRLCRLLLLLVIAMASIAYGAHPAFAAKRYKVYLSLSYTGNDWQAEAENMIRALAASSAMKDKIRLDVQVSGANAQRQSQQIDAMVQAGANAIIMYASSETLLNAAIKNACDRGVVVVAYDSFVSAPCAYNITTDAAEFGRVGAEWLVKAMHEKGNIVMVTGVPGVSTDTARTDAAKAVFAKYPDIHVIASIVGLWSQTVLRSELSKTLATHPWSQIDGLWIQVGCYTANAMEDEAGIPDAQKRPCAGEGSNGHRIQMLPAGTRVVGATGAYRPMGYPSISRVSPPYEGPLALKYAVDILEGKSHPKLTITPDPVVTNADIKLCQTGSWQEMNTTHCNVFEPATIKNPGWFAGIFSTQLPEVGLAAALHRKPEN